MQNIIHYFLLLLTVIGISVAQYEIRYRPITVVLTNVSGSYPNLVDFSLSKYAFAKSV